MLLFNSGLEAEALQLVGEVFGFFFASVENNTFSRLVHFEHFDFCFLRSHLQHLLKDVDYVGHGVDRVVPNNCFPDCFLFRFAAGFCLL